jgi:AraC-like DNA-binding protein
VSDPLSEILRTVRLTGGVFLDARFTAPWCVTSQITPDDCRPFLAQPAQVIAYHYVIDGRMLVQLDCEPPLEIGAGEIILLPRNDPHTLGSGPGLEAISADGLIQPGAEGALARVTYGGGGRPTHIVCGFLGSEEAQNPLIATLPRMLKLDVKEGTSREWVEASLRLAARELAEGKLASSGLMSRLSELLFVEAVRRYAASLPDSEAGWLKGLRDPYVGRALALIHSELNAPWTAEALAKEVALSRSAFVDRFASLVGMPPIRYLTQWRLLTARLRLREGGQSIRQVAHAVGYDSEEAFSRAFKRSFGMAPAQWRDRFRQE